MTSRYSVSHAERQRRRTLPLRPTRPDACRPPSSRNPCSVLPAQGASSRTRVRLGPGSTSWYRLAGDLDLVAGRELVLSPVDPRPQLSLEHPELLVLGRMPVLGQGTPSGPYSASTSSSSGLLLRIVTDSLGVRFSLSVICLVRSWVLEADRAVGAA